VNTMNVGQIAIGIFMIVLMFSSGLQFDRPMFRKQSSRLDMRGFWGLALANYVVIPLLTLCIIRLAAFPPVVNMVLLALAMLPCAPIVPAMVSMANEPAEWSLWVFLSMSVLSIAMVPLLILTLFIPWVAGNDTTIGGADGAAIAKYFISVYVPMGAGAAMRAFAPRWAA